MTRSGVGFARVSGVPARRLYGWTQVQGLPMSRSLRHTRRQTAGRQRTPAIRFCADPGGRSSETPQLNALEEQVPGGNQNLKGLEARFREARAAIRFNRASEFPTISTAPSIASIRDSANRPYLPAGVARATGDFVLPFDVSYELDFWGRVRRTVAAAREFAQASAADLETAKLSLQAELAFDYFELRSADAQKQILDNTVESYAAALRLTQNRYQGGAAPKSDVAQAADTARNGAGAGHRYRRATIPVRACHRHPDRKASGGVQSASGAIGAAASGYSSGRAGGFAGAATGYCSR